MSTFANLGPSDGGTWASGSAGGQTGGGPIVATVDSIHLAPEFNSCLDEKKWKKREAISNGNK